MYKAHFYTLTKEFSDSLNLCSKIMLKQSQDCAKLFYRGRGGGLRK